MLCCLFYMKDSVSNITALLEVLKIYIEVLLVLIWEKWLKKRLVLSKFCEIRKGCYVPAEDPVLG